MKTSLADWTVIAVLIVTALCAMLAGCGVLSTLQVVVDATTAAVPILEAAGVPIPPQIPLYVAAVADCVANADVANPTTGQLVTIGACLAQQIEPTLPPGTPQAIANIIAAIAQDVAKFLEQNNVQAAKLKTTGLSEYKALKTGDVQKFHALTSKARATAAAARKLVKP